MLDIVNSMSVNNDHAIKKVLLLKIYPEDYPEDTTTFLGKVPAGIPTKETE